MRIRRADAFGRTPYTYHGEFDPGSERTLAACLKHASRTKTMELQLAEDPGDSGERVSNT